MELTADIAALRDTPEGDVVIVSDSKYVVDCVNAAWYKRWQQNGWKTSGNKDVLNRDLWEALLTQMQRRVDAGYTARFEWTKGHAGDAANERADQLASSAATVASAAVSGTGR
jgi:ribonuclease HI